MVWVFVALRLKQVVLTGLLLVKSQVAGQSKQSPLSSSASLIYTSPHPLSSPTRPLLSPVILPVVIQSGGGAEAMIDRQNHSAVTLAGKQGVFHCNWKAFRYRPALAYWSGLSVKTF